MPRKPVRKFKEANLIQWKDLLQAAVVVKQMNPWEHLWSTDLITIQFPEEEEPVYCSILGKGGECFGVCVYDGIQAIQDFSLLVESQGIPPMQTIRYQNCLGMYLADRLDLEKEDARILRETGMKFYGKREWIYFRSMSKGLFPWYLDQTEVLWLTKVYRQLAKALRSLLSQKVVVDFRGGETLLRVYDPGTKDWVSKAAPHHVKPLVVPVPMLRDELLAARIRQRPVYQETLELDLLMRKESILEESLGRPLMPMLLAMADTKSGTILAHRPLTYQDNEMDQIFDIVVRFVMEQGRPKVIQVRDQRVKAILADLCAKAGIMLEIRPSLPVLDALVQTL